MRTFEEWMEDEKIDEGWKTNLALGGALAAGAMGLGSSDKPEPESQPVAAAQQSQQGDSLGKAKGKEVRHRRAGLQRKAQQLRDTGRTSGSFVDNKLTGGKLTPSKDPRKDISNVSLTFGNKDIQNKSTTSPEAGRFLK